MTIKELKKELGLKDKDLAEFFGLKHRSYSESSAKKRYEQAFINIYNFLKGDEKKTIKLLPLNSIKCTELMSKDYRRIQTKEDYIKLIESGMFWEFHPELTGNWEVDRVIILADS